MAFDQLILRGFMLAVLLGAMAAGPVNAGTPVVFMHIHGLGFSADGARLMIGGHQGMVAYADGRWAHMGGPGHDHAGFSVTRNALYSSGHPAPGSGLPDPVGFIKSVDGGKTWRAVGLKVDADFHILAASYETNVVYVANRVPTSRMSETGVHYTRNDGVAWHRAALQGLGGPMHQLAVHPTDPKQLAAGTDTGLYVSRDWGDNFERIGAPAFVLAVAFDLDGAHLWSSSYVADKPVLAKVRLDGDTEAEDVPLPPLTEDAVAHIAQNPARRSEIAIATFKRSVFVSPDQDLTWTQLARDGAGRQ